MSNLLEKLPAAPGERYYPQLDGLRALAVATVFIGHLIPLPLLQKIVGWGDIGVVLFFCLSGFLITGILLKIDCRELTGKAVAIRSFYVRRALRIFPIYYLTIALAVAVGYGPVRVHLLRLVTYSLNVPGLPPTDNLWAVAHFWSLSVEEQFYLFWPMVVLFFPRQFLRRFLVALIGLAFLYKLSLALVNASYTLVFASLLGCLDSLGLGALLAIGWSEAASRAGTVRRWVRAGMAGGAVWVILTVVRIAVDMDANYAGYLWVGVVTFAAAAVAFTGLIAFAASGTQGLVGRFLENRFMVMVGRISYGLYVYHFFMRYILRWMVSRQYLHLSSLWNYAWLSILMSAVAAVVSWHLIEKPILRLKKYFNYGVPANATPA